MAQEDVFKKIVSHCKEYGFVFPSSDIYDGLGAVYDYGQNGVELKNNIKQYWWQSMVLLHENIVGIDAAIFMHPTTWKASGHVDAFNDPLIDNRDSKKRYRADVLIEDQIAKYEEKINKEIAKAAKKFGDSFHASWGALEESDPGGYQELRSWTLSEQNLNLNVPFYMDNGTVHVIAHIGSPAGASYIDRDLVLNLENDIGQMETAQLGDYLTVKRQGNAVTLRIRQTPRLEALLREYGLINTDAALYDKDLTVGGLYSSYTKIFCGEIGEADEPFVFLLTQEGWVEYIDVLSCLSCGYFCGGPLLGVADAKSLVHSSADGLPDIWAITEKGEKLGLWDIVSCQRYTIPASLQNSGWWNDEIGGSLTVSEGNGDNFNYCVFRETGSVSVDIHGNLNYLGMTEKGMVYAYRLWGAFSNGPGLTGVAAFDQRSEFNGDDYESTLTVTELCGTPLLGDQTGDTTVLMQSFG